jgi:hypothetical protein
VPDGRQVAPGPPESRWRVLAVYAAVIALAVLGGVLAIYLLPAVLS